MYSRYSSPDGYPYTFFSVIAVLNELGKDRSEYYMVSHLKNSCEFLQLYPG